jgi:hypothetical protein
MCAIYTTADLNKSTFKRNMNTEKLCYYNPALIKETAQQIEVDVCIYGGNAAGVMAAVQAARMGLQVVVLEQSYRLGGLTSGGLSCTDVGAIDAIGGLSRDFYRRAGQHYGVDEEWRFEPHVAAEVLTAYLEEAGVPVYFRQFLQHVKKEDRRLRSITMEGGLQVRAKIFLDCSYEGDLMAAAGVSYHVGREGNAVYDETFNGAQKSLYHQFDVPISPYITDGDPKSGLLPGIEKSVYIESAGDDCVQAYNFRLCLSKNPHNQIPFEKPADYDEREYALLARHLKAGWDGLMGHYDSIRGDKCDLNNSGALSTDFIGRNFDYPEADYMRREEVFQAHVTYQKGLMWFRSYDPAVPKKMREQQQQWALAADEFTETGGWPHQLYIREARRMVSDYVMTEHHCMGRAIAEDSIGLAAYMMDSHNCRRLFHDGKVFNEGDVEIKVSPYPISQRAICPRNTECENLLVPVCLSSSHIAFGSIRMEPVFMILGQSAATIAAIALENNSAVQDVPYAELREQLAKDGQVVNLCEKEKMLELSASY